MKAKNATTPDPLDLDAILLREVAAHRSPAGSVLAGAPEHARTVMPSPEPSTVAPDDTATAAIPSGYEALFLTPRSVRERSAVYVSAATKGQLAQVIRRLGCGVSLTTYVENILAHHLTLFREQINLLHRQRNTHDIL